MAPSGSLIRYLWPRNSKARPLEELGRFFCLLFCSPGWPQDVVVLNVFCARFPPREASYASSNY